MEARKRVLVVEDDESIRDSLRDFLELEEFDVECAANGEEGLERLRDASRRPDVILLDLMMPIMDGFQFRRAQLEDPSVSSIPVIALTADGRVDENGAVLKLDGCIKKPADLDTILSVVSRCCERHLSSNRGSEVPESACVE